MKNNVTFLKNKNVLASYLETKLRNIFPKNSSVLIKLHMGEPGNRHYIKASFARTVIDILLDNGCKPFVFDTPVAYDSPRNNPEGYLRAAADHGYTEEQLNAPVVISDVSKRTSGRYMDYEIAAASLDADGVLLLSHVKGHICSGMGGAIKNVGMGCMSRATKGAIHTGGEPIYGEGCTQCGLCAENCPTENIRINKNRPWFDVSWCSGCSNCILSCPENCLSPKKEIFDRLLADAAVTAHEKFRKVFAVNLLLDMTKLCDCMPDPGPVIIEDIGYICGDDMLSVDLASLVMLREKTLSEDIFMEHNKVSSWRHIRATAEYMNSPMEIDIEKI